MTPRKRKVGKETTPGPQTAWAAIAEMKTSVDGQLETTGDLRERVKALETIGDLRERVKALETESKHYATKAWAVTGVAGALLSIVIVLARLFFGN